MVRKRNVTTVPPPDRSRRVIAPSQLFGASEPGEDSRRQFMRCRGVWRAGGVGPHGPASQDQVEACDTGCLAAVVAGADGVTVVVQDMRQQSRGSLVVFDNEHSCGRIGVVGGVDGSMVGDAVGRIQVAACRRACPDRVKLL